MTGGLPFLPIIVIVVVFFGQLIVTSRYDWRCGDCGHVFAIAPLTACVLPHSFPFRKLATCPNCGARTWVSPVRKDPQNRH